MGPITGPIICTDVERHLHGLHPAEHDSWSGPWYNSSMRSEMHKIEHDSTNKSAPRSCLFIAWPSEAMHIVLHAGCQDGADDE